MSGDRFLMNLLFSLYKGISANKNVLVTFYTKSLLLLLKGASKVCGINSSDMVPNVFW